MDKLTRVLMLYSRLLRGEQINKAAFCIETESNWRSFDRDIEDLRLYLSDSYSTEELLYDRNQNCYYLSGVAKQELGMMEFELIARILTASKILSKDELTGLLYILASNTTKPTDALNRIETNIKEYKNNTYSSIIKIHADITYAISNRKCINIKYFEDCSKPKYFEIIPYDIEIKDEELYLIAANRIEEKIVIYRFLLDKIDSFTNVRNISLSEWKEIEKYIMGSRDK